MPSTKKTRRTARGPLRAPAANASKAARTAKGQADAPRKPRAESAARTATQERGRRGGRGSQAPTVAAPRSGPSGQIRGETVVSKVLTATLELLATLGYDPLTIETVAKRAGVNKTTVYRRWPTKPDLVRSALESIAPDTSTLPNTGSLRSDLLIMTGYFVRFASSVYGKGIIRMMMAACADSELSSIARTLRTQKEAGPLSVIKKAIAQGKLAPGTDPELIVSLLIGPIHHRFFVTREEVDAKFCEQVIDAVLFGLARPRGKKPAL